MSFPSRASNDSAPLLEEFEVVDEDNQKLDEKTTYLRYRESFWLRVRPFGDFSLKVCTALLPSFLQPSPDSPIVASVHPTAWLDGVRGVAAFLVYVYHWQHMFHQGFNYGYASNNGDNDHWVIQLPIIRLLANGQVQVATFYVLSGVSLSLKPLRLARSHAWDEFFDTMFSSVFRRALRLYLPIFAVQTGVLLATLFGFYNHGYALSQDWPFAGTNELMHKVFDTNAAQIEDWVRAMWNFANPFIPNRPMYDVHLWTIPIEFRCSIILFATLVGLAKLMPRTRMCLVFMFWMYCMSWSVVESQTALFMAGMGIAEFMLIQKEAKEGVLLRTVEHKRWYKHPAMRHACSIAVGVIGLHFLSYPPWNADRTLGYRTLARITPSHNGLIEYFWQRLGAAVFTLGLSGSEYLRWPFQTRIIRYLGKISFPLYIIHGPVNHTLGLWLATSFMNLIGADTFVRYESAVALAFFVELFVVIWLADLVMRTIDEPSVRFGRWLQKKWEVK